MNSTGVRRAAASHSFALSLTATCAIALLARVWHLGRASIWYDEGVTIGVARFTWAEFLHFIKVEPNSILYYLLMRAACFFGESEFYLRFTSVVFGTASIAVFAVFAKRIFNDAVALVTAALLALMPLHVVYTREIRGYALLLFLVALGWFALERCLHDGRTRWFAIWGACIVLAMYVHVFSVFVLASQLCTLPFAQEFRDRRHLFFKTFAWIAAGYLPSLILVLGSHRQHLFWIPPISFKLTSIFFSEYAGGGRLLIALSLLLFAASCVSFVDVAGKKLASKRWPWAVATLGTLVPIGLLALISLVQPAFVARYALQSQLAFALAAAAVLCRFHRTVTVGMLVALTALYAPVILSMDQNPPWEDQRNDYRSAVEHIIARSKSGDALAVWGPYSRFSIEYYERRLAHSDFPRLVYPTPDANRADDTFALRPVVQQLDSIANNNRRIWLFLDENRPFEELGAYPHFFLRRFGMGHKLVSETRFRDAIVYEFEAK